MLCCHSKNYRVLTPRRCTSSSLQARSRPSVHSGARCAARTTAATEKFTILLALPGTENSAVARPIAGRIHTYYTVALQDLDGIEEPRRSRETGSHGSSSVDNILPRPDASYGPGKDNGAIRVTNEVQVGYSANDRSMGGNAFGGSGVTSYRPYR